MLLEAEIIIAQNLLDNLLNIHGMGEGIADILVLEYLVILVEPHSHSRLLGIVKKPYPVNIAVFDDRRFAFDVPVIRKRDAKHILLGFFEMLPHQIEVPDDLKYHPIDIEAVFEIAQVLGPPVLFTLEFNRLPFFEIGYLVRAGIRFDFPVEFPYEILIEFTDKNAGGSD